LNQKHWDICRMIFYVIIEVKLIDWLINMNKQLCYLKLSYRPTDAFDVLMLVYFPCLLSTYKFHTVDTVHLRHIKLSYRPTDASVGLKLNLKWRRCTVSTVWNFVILNQASFWKCCCYSYRIISNTLMSLYKDIFSAEFNKFSMNLEGNDECWRGGDRENEFLPISGL
jgi:hypothetical protein